MSTELSDPIAELITHFQDAEKASERICAEFIKMHQELPRANEHEVSAAVLYSFLLQIQIPIEQIDELLASWKEQGMMMTPATVAGTLVKSIAGYSEEERVGNTRDVVANLFRRIEESKIPFDRYPRLKANFELYQQIVKDMMSEGSSDKHFLKGFMIKLDVLFGDDYANQWERPQIDQFIAEIDKEVQVAMRGW